MYPRARGRSAAALGVIRMVSQILLLLDSNRVGKGLNSCNSLKRKLEDGT